MEGKEIKGSFVFDDIIFKAGYRSGFPIEHQGGYDKCLRVYTGSNGLNGREYFGDDKFKVTRVEEFAEWLIIYLDTGLHQKGKFTFEESDSKIVKLLRSDSIDVPQNLEAKLTNEKMRMLEIFGEISRITGCPIEDIESGEEDGLFPD